MQATTKSTKIVRALAGSRVRVYNDRLKDGTRSIKVETWLERDYDQARRVLEATGLKTVKKIVQGQPRLHVKE